MSLIVLAHELKSMRRSTVPSLLAIIALWMPARAQQREAPQTPVQQSPARPPVRPRVQVKQEDMCCFSMHFVAPEYPREARLKHIQGEAKLAVVVSPPQGNIVTDLHAVSGDPLLVAAAMKAASQWTFQMTYGGFTGPGPAPDLEIPLTFTFVIDDPPKPAWIHLTDGSAIRADEVREYEDGLEYTSKGRSHRIATERVSVVDACRRIVLIHLIAKPEDGDCNDVVGGGPYFTIRAFPLLATGDRPVDSDSIKQPPHPCTPPDDLGRLLHASYPGGKIVTFADLSKDEQDNFPKEAESRCPGFTAVDFYGDGNPTYAIELVWNLDKDPTTKLFIAHKPGNSWHLRVVDKADGPVPVLLTAKSGEYESIYRDRKIVAAHPTVMLRGFGSFWIVYGWIDHRVQKVWLRD